MLWCPGLRKHGRIIVLSVAQVRWYDLLTLQRPSICPLAWTMSAILRMFNPCDSLKSPCCNLRSRYCPDVSVPEGFSGAASEDAVSCMSSIQEKKLEVTSSDHSDSRIGLILGEMVRQMLFEFERTHLVKQKKQNSRNARTDVCVHQLLKTSEQTQGNHSKHRSWRHMDDNQPAQFGRGGGGYRRGGYRGRGRGGGGQYQDLDAQQQPQQQQDDGRPNIRYQQNNYQGGGGNRFTDGNNQGGGRFRGRGAGSNVWTRGGGAGGGDGGGGRGNRGRGRGENTWGRECFCWVPCISKYVSCEALFTRVAGQNSAITFSRASDLMIGLDIPLTCEKQADKSNVNLTQIPVRLHQGPADIFPAALILHHYTRESQCTVAPGSMLHVYVICSLNV